MPSSALSWVFTADLGDPEVEHLGDLDDPAVDLGLHQEDVLGLEIAVHDAGAVGGGERRTDLAHDRQHLVERHRAACDALRERFALEVVEHEVRHAVRRDVVVDHPDDVGVVELGGDLGLALEPSDDVDVLELGVQDLDRDPLARQAVVACQKHRAHPAAAEQRLDLVGIGNDRPHIDDRARG